MKTWQPTAMRIHDTSNTRICMACDMRIHTIRLPGQPVGPAHSSDAARVRRLPIRYCTLTGSGFNAWRTNHLAARLQGLPRRDISRTGGQTCAMATCHASLLAMFDIQRPPLTDHQRLYQVARLSMPGCKTVYSNDVTLCFPRFRFHGHPRHSALTRIFATAITAWLPGKRPICRADPAGTGQRHLQYSLSASML